MESRLDEVTGRFEIKLVGVSFGDYLVPRIYKQLSTEWVKEEKLMGGQVILHPHNIYQHRIVKVFSMTSKTNDVLLTLRMDLVFLILYMLWLSLLRSLHTSHTALQLVRSCQGLL